MYNRRLEAKRKMRRFLQAEQELRTAIWEKRPDLLLAILARQVCEAAVELGIAERAAAM